jgi:hypothetical protein
VVAAAVSTVAIAADSVEPSKLSSVVDAPSLPPRAPHTCQSSVGRLCASMHTASEYDSSSLFLQSAPAFEVKYVEVADKDRMFLEASSEFGFNGTLIHRLDIGAHALWCGESSARSGSNRVALRRLLPSSAAVDICATPTPRVRPRSRYRHGNSPSFRSGELEELT